MSLVLVVVVVAVVAVVDLLQHKEDGLDLHIQDHSDVKVINDCYQI